MIDILLTIILLLLIGYVAFKEWIVHKERNKMLNALLARNNQELVNLQLADKTEIKKTVAPVNEAPSEFVPESMASQEMFEKALGLELGSYEEENGG